MAHEQSISNHQVAAQTNRKPHHSQRELHHLICRQALTVQRLHRRPATDRRESNIACEGWVVRITSRPERIASVVAPVMRRARSSTCQCGACYLRYTRLTCDSNHRPATWKCAHSTRLGTAVLQRKSLCCGAGPAITSQHLSHIKLRAHAGQYMSRSITLLRRPIRSRIPPVLGQSAALLGSRSPHFRAVII